MSHVHTSRPVRVTALAAVALVLIAALAVAGCGGTVLHPGGPAGNGMPTSVKVVPDDVRAQALDQLRSLDVTFDPDLVSVRYGNAQTRLIVTGPLTGPARLNPGLPKKGPAVIGFSEIDLSLQGGAWAVVRTKLQ